MYATDGRISFDFHGYALRERLLTRYWRGYRRRFPGWSAQVRKIDFPLLDTCELNRRKHLGPDQFFADPIPRARRFIAAKTCPGALRVTA
jgi:hypothetical protein